VVSLLCEFILAIRLSAAPVVAPYYNPSTGIEQRRFFLKNLKMETVSVRESASPYLEFYYYPELSLISFVKPTEKYTAFDPPTGTVWQIMSHSKLTIRQDAKSKNSTRKRSFKTKQISNFRSIEWHTKNILQNLVRLSFQVPPTSSVKMWINTLAAYSTPGIRWF
jgi:hypothetical protein